jgi:hypothetical protein
LVFAHKPTLQWWEAISLAQCIRVLGGHPIRLVCPKGMDVTAYRRIAPGLVVDFIRRSWLSSYRAYNRLKILPYLYRRYADFEYLLTHELDAFVFRDELLDWCNQHWDYIGAPSFQGYLEASPDAPPTVLQNSGFSLRRIGAALKVSSFPRYIAPFSSVLQEWRHSGRWSAGSLFLLFSRLTVRNNFWAPFNDFGGNEDDFWCNCAAQRFTWYRLAPYESARMFSYEMNPARLYREAQNRLPFGCHKWPTLSPEFWFPIIRSHGYVIPEGI